MSETQPNQPWPIWGRVLFWIVFVAVLAVAAIAAFHGHVHGAAVRIAVAVVVVPGIVLALVGLLTRRGLGRRQARLDDHLAALGARIDEDARQPAAARTSGASDSSLQHAAAVVADARQRLSAGDVAGAAASTEQLSGVASGWQGGSPLGTAAAACLADNRRLSRLVRSAQRAAR